MYTADVDLDASPRRMEISDEHHNVVRTVELATDEHINDALAREQLYPLGVEQENERHVRITVLPRLDRSADGPFSIAIDMFAQKIIASFGDTAATFDIDQANSVGVMLVDTARHAELVFAGNDARYVAWLNFERSPALVVKAITPDEQLPWTIDEWQIDWVGDLSRADDALHEHGWHRHSEWHPTVKGKVAIVTPTEPRRRHAEREAERRRGHDVPPAGTRRIEAQDDS
ncbi:hypothetical protein [Phytoactinopolyspora halotolerans]|uniref:Uncharacterized protein n=1 Tax=Phytoactinopolyspora halotolerans TaxID=1981512 RepID=A0A6L9S7S8_9ACTN|nr:hypothetical protein [Phytoactinopolyspora halotolerans]NEE01159.1 hypothetical protein [Phytoactinopolyspora halotolerans]